jgi:hypothetical protein
MATKLGSFAAGESAMFMMQAKPAVNCVTAWTIVFMLFGAFEYAISDSVAKPKISAIARMKYTGI